MKKIFKVEAHDAYEVDYPCTSPADYVTEQSKEDFMAQLEKDHDGSIVIDDVTEITVDEVVRLLNLYID